MKKFVSIALLLMLTMTFAVCSYAEENAYDVEAFGVNPLYEDVLNTEWPENFEHREALATFSTPVFTTSKEEIGEIFRENMEARVETFVVYYRTSEYPHSGTEDEKNNFLGKIIEEFIDEAVEHTGDPTEGDYIRWNYGRWGAGGSTRTQNGVSDMTLTITLEYYTSAEQEEELSAAIDELIESFDFEGKSQYEKVCIIYDYLCDNIVYDYDNLYNDAYKLKFTAYAALFNKTSVCQGYANLFYRLALEEGIDARLIAGLGNGGAHGWNIVRLAGKYYNLDATWDSGRNQYSYFLLNNADFENHTRYSEYDSDSFNTDYVMAEKSYGMANEDSIVAGGFCGAEAPLGKNLVWSLDTNGVLTVSGSGKMADYDYDTPWLPYANSITAVVIEEGLTNIGNYAFAGLSKLSGTVVIPEGVESIGDWAFDTTWDLDGVVIPASVKTVGEYVFDRNGIKNITVAEANTVFCDVDGVLCTEDRKTVVKFPLGRTGEYQIPSGFERIAEGAFNGAKVEKIIVPGTIKVLEDMAFYNVNGTIVIEGQLDSIGGYMFLATNGDLYVYFLDGEPKAYYSATGFGENSIFNANNGNLYAYYLYGTEDKWTFDADGKWHGYTVNKYIPGVEFDPSEYVAYGYCGNDESASYKNLAWMIDENGTLTIKGSGKMADYSFNSAPWYEHKALIKSLVIEEGITHIGCFAFAGLSNLSGAVVIPEGVETMGEWAFRSNKISSISFPSTIGDIANFCQVSSELEEITVAEGNSMYYTIDGVLFSKYEKTLMCAPGKMTGEYRIPDGTETIGFSAFWGVKTETIYVPESVKTLGSMSFYRVKGKVIIEGQLDMIRADAFHISGDELDIYFLAGEAKAITIGNENPDDGPFMETGGEINLYYLAGTEDKWTFDTDGKWHGYEVDPYYGYADVNCDFKVDVRDAYCVRLIAAKLTETSDYQKIVGDVNGDGKINAIDANIIRKYAVGKIKNLPIAE